MAIKKELFAKLDKIAKPGAILASNTSYLNVDEIASATSRPQDVVGMHFFSPANVMKLLEVVRGAKTAPDVLATAMDIGKTIGKVAVVSGVCHGFIGNRMLAQRQAQANALILEGAMPWDVDRVAYDFGWPMGPFQMSDLAGLDIGWSKETSKGATIRERLCELDRRGQKTGAGFYDYDAKRNRSNSALVEKLILDFAAEKGIQRRKIDDAGDPRAAGLPDDQRGREDPGRRHRAARQRHRRGLDLRLRLAGVPRRADVLCRHRRRGQCAWRRWRSTCRASATALPSRRCCGRWPARASASPAERWASRSKRRTAPSIWLIRMPGPSQPVYRLDMQRRRTLQLLATTLPLVAPWLADRAAAQPLSAARHAWVSSALPWRLALPASGMRSGRACAIWAGPRGAMSCSRCALPTTSTSACRHWPLSWWPAASTCWPPTASRHAAASRATSTVPILMASVADPVAAGLVASYARPEGNVTGIAFLRTRLAAKPLQLLKDAMPGLSRAAVLSNPRNAAFSDAMFEAMSAAAAALQVQVQRFDAPDPADYAMVFAQMSARRMEAVAITEEATLIGNAAPLAALALQRRLPSVGNTEFAQAGGLLGYGANREAIFRRAAVLADKLLRGVKPADLPIEQPTQFELLINGRTAAALSLVLPAPVRLRADRVIE